jgi:hypothetical protein
VFDSVFTSLPAGLSFVNQQHSIQVHSQDNCLALAQMQFLGKGGDKLAVSNDLAFDPWSLPKECVAKLFTDCIGNQELGHY